MLPQAFPGGMPYWASMMDKTSLDLRSIERLELSPQKPDVGASDLNRFGVDVQRISIPLITQ